MDIAMFTFVALGIEIGPSRTVLNRGFIYCLALFPLHFLSINISTEILMAL